MKCVEIYLYLWFGRFMFEKKEGRIALYFNEIEDAAKDYTKETEFSDEDVECAELEARKEFIYEHHKILQKLTRRKVKGKKLDKLGLDVATFLLHKYEDSLRYGCAYAYCTYKELFTEVAIGAGYEPTPNKLRSMNNSWIDKTEEILISLEIIDYDEKNSALNNKINAGDRVKRMRLRSLFKLKPELRMA